MKRSNFAVLKQEFVLSIFLPATTILLIMGGAQAWIQTFYFNDPFNQRVGWISQDGPWPKEYAFGVHYFGDYFTMNQHALLSDPWSQFNIYPPAAVALFKLFAIFPYKVGLLLWMSFAIACFVSPIIHASKRFTLGTRIQIIFITVLGSAPVIGTLDRGNCIFVLVPLLYFGYTSMQNQKYLLSGALIGSAAAVKLYPLLIILFLIVLRKWRVAINSIAVFIFLTLSTALIWSHPIRSILQTIKYANSWNGLDKEGQVMIFSFAGILNNLLVFFHLSGSHFSSFVLTNSRVIGVILLIAFLIISFGTNELNVFLLALSTIQLIPTVSYTYTRIWTIVALSLLILNSQGSPNYQKFSRGVEKWWWLMILTTNSLLTVFVLHPISLGPVISLVCLAMVMRNSFSSSEIRSGIKSFFSNTYHVDKVNRNSFSTKG